MRLSVWEIDYSHYYLNSVLVQTVGVLRVVTLPGLPANLRVPKVPKLALSTPYTGPSSVFLLCPRDDPSDTLMIQMTPKEKTNKRQTNQHGLNGMLVYYNSMSSSWPTASTSPGDRIPPSQHSVHYKSQVPSLMVSIPRQHNASPAAQPLLAGQPSRLFLLHLGKVGQNAPRLHPLVVVVKMARKGDAGAHTSKPVWQPDAGHDLLHHGPRQSDLFDLDASVSRI